MEQNQQEANKGMLHNGEHSLSQAPHKPSTQQPWESLKGEGNITFPGTKNLIPSMSQLQDGPSLVCPWTRYRTRFPSFFHLGL